ncbi:MAG: hypothetical protein IPM96_09650 [Ignavibacteria bacterium]|nr:hypothetical protein [Ignavibacteria bacterium]
METVFINARISENKKSEFFQVIESLKTLIEDYCKDFELKIEKDNSVNISITFEDKVDLEENFNNKEFNILKGSIRSLCDKVEITINDNVSK